MCVELQKSQSADEIILDIALISNIDLILSLGLVLRIGLAFSISVRLLVFRNKLKIMTLYNY